MSQLAPLAQPVRIRTVAGSEVRVSCLDKEVTEEELRKWEAKSLRKGPESKTSGGSMGSFGVPQHGSHRCHGSPIIMKERF